MIKEPTDVSIDIGSRILFNFLSISVVVYVVQRIYSRHERIDYPKPCSHLSFENLNSDSVP